MPFTPGMTALDIGSGLGKAMRSLTAAGFDSFGIEPSAIFRSRSIELMGIAPDRVQHAPVEEAEYPPEFFDLISFGAVLEHLYDPKAALEKALGGSSPMASSTWKCPRRTISWPG